MNSYNAQCIGQYMNCYIIDRIDFINKMQQGMSLEEYWYIQKNKKEIFISRGTKNAVHPFLCYRFIVNGKTYYGTSKVGYSRDIHARMAGKPCKVYYRSDNPYISSPGDINGNIPDDESQPLSIVAMVMGILSLSLFCIPFASIAISGISFALSLIARSGKKTNNYFALAGIICSGIALLSGIFCTIAFMFLYYSKQLPF